MYQHPGSRPVNLNLLAFRFPLNAYLSILHRISGVLLVVALSVGLIWFNSLILWPEEFSLTVAWLHTWVGKGLVAVLCTSLWFHWLAGLRHLMLEHDLWQLQSLPDRGRLSGWVMLVVFLIGLVFLVWKTCL